MYTLIISTFNKYIYLALIKDESLIELIKKETNQSHSIYTMPLIQEILKNASITVQDLNQIEVINGPGSFTGVRIGVTIAKTLAYTLNIPIKSISSIEAYAVSFNKNTKKVITINDMKGTYYGCFDEKNNLLEPLNYLNKKDFQDYINKNNLEKYLVEEPELNFLNIYNFLKTKKSENPHHVNPLYIKQIEALT